MIMFKVYSMMNLEAFEYFTTLWKINPEQLTLLNKFITFRSETVA